MARARAEYGRLIGQDDPQLWQAAINEFDYGYRYEIARTRWRLAAALVTAGDRRAAQSEAEVALAQATQIGARPLAEAVRDLIRRARLELPGARPVTDLHISPPTQMQGRMGGQQG